MKLTKTILFVIAVLVIGTSSVIAQNISGNANVAVGSTESYSYSGSYSSGYRWVAVGGTIIGSNTGLNVTVSWSGSAGSGRIDFYPSAFSFVPHEYTVTRYTNPPTPSTPSVSNNNCGSKTVTRGNPPSGITWYWQTSSGGVSTSNSGSTYTRSSSGYVYLRARRNATGQWSSTRSLYVTVNQAPGTPSTPSVSSNSCGNKTVTRGNPPSGVTWYWQTSSGGYSTSNSSSTYTVTTSRTMYLRARNNSSGCWSGVRSVYVTVNQAPAQPPALTVSSNTCGTRTVSRPDLPGYYWQNSSSGTSTSNADLTLNVHSSRWVYLRARSSNGCWSTARSVYVTVNPVPGIPSVPSVSSNVCGNKTITRGTPPTGVTWFWQTSSGGTSMNNSSSTYTKASSGNVYLRPRNNSTGCWGSTRTVSVTVNQAPAAPTVSDASLCGSGSATLVVNGYTFNQFAPFKWYTSGGTLITSGVSSITQSVSSTTNYYVTRYDENTLCESGQTQATIIVQAPTHTIGSAESHCQTNGFVPLTGEPVVGGTWSINGPSSAIVLGNGLDMTELTPGQTYTATYTYSSGSCTSSNTFTKNFYVEPLTVAGNITGDMVRCGSGNSTFTLSGNTGTVTKWESRYKDGAGNWNGWNLITDINTLSVNPSLAEWTAGVRTYEIKATVQSGACAIAEATHQITINPASVGGTVSGATEGFGMASGNVTLGGETGDVQRWEQSTDGGATWSPISHTANIYPYSTEQTTLYRAVVKSGVCNEVASASTQITILPVPTLVLGSSQCIRPGQSTTLTATAGHAAYQWFRNNEVIPGETNNQLVVTMPGTYEVTISSAGGASYTLYETVCSQFEEDQNIIITYNYRVPIANSADPFSYNADEQNVSAQIFDGLGRAIQQVSLEASPGYEDIVQPIDYDIYGRQTKSYLPYADPGSSSLYKSAALSDQYNYYLNVSPHADATAYAETRFETSMLNRTLEQGAPGAEWQLSTGKTVSTEYGIADADEVIIWEFESTTPEATGKYVSGLLYKTITNDENGNNVITYTNKEGQTILKKSQVSNDPVTWAKTYYIYDLRGNLRVVLPPEAVKLLGDAFVGTPAQTFLDLWTFQYKYDGRKRMISKKVPGAEKISMVYDQWDRLVLTQDGVQQANDEWLFTSYDEFNRPVITGLLKDTNPSHQSQGDMQTWLMGLTDRFMTFSSGGTNHEYGLGAFPYNQTSGTLTIEEEHTVTYYDNYDWDNSSVAYTNPAGLTQNTAVLGQVTGTLTKAGNNWITSASYYDDKYRVIQAVSTNHLGGSDILTNHYDFIGQVTKTITDHANSDTTYSIARSFVYDHTGRLLETWHKLESDSDSVLLARNSYNALGELEQKNLHKETGGVFAQSLDYTYNIRGWLKKINDPILTDGDLFGMELHYADNPLDAGRINFNGNISAMEWSNYDINGSGIGKRAYTYDYDDLNRLIDAQHYKDGASGVDNPFDVEIPSYDLNGNILSLIRNGKDGSHMDNLDYTYNGNRLLNVTDQPSGTSEGFNDENYYLDETPDPTDSNNDYSYDANGNMISDANKGITSIAYNHLNLPTKVTFDAQNYIEYLYDAAGIKLQQKVWRDDTLRKTTDYVGEFIYETDSLGDRKLQLVQHEEGRITYMEYEGEWDYQYHLKDHLGNVRLTFSTTPDVYERIATMEFNEEQEAFDYWVQSSRNGLSTVGNTSSYVMRLNTDTQGDSTLIEGIKGLANMFQVQKGDKVDLSVKAYYEAPPASDGWFASNLLFNLLVSGSTGSTTANEGAVTSSNNVDATVVAGIQAGKDSTVNSTVPRAYMNWLVFDKDTILVNSGYKQISNSAHQSWETVVPTNGAVEIEEDGFFYAYVSNETNALSIVDFDDFRISLTKTNVVSSQDYYPFGLTFNESVRVANTEQRFKYNQGTGDKQFRTERIVELDVDMTKRRIYDFTIGRFWQVDPLADEGGQESLTPYQYSFNNPILYNDPLGEMGTCCGTASGRPSRRNRRRSQLRANIRRTVSEASRINRLPNGFGTLTPRQGTMFTRTTSYSTGRGNGTSPSGTGNRGITNDTHEMGNNGGNAMKGIGEIISFAKKIIAKSETITKVESFTESGVSIESLGFDIVVGDMKNTMALMQLQQDFSDEIMKNAQGDLTDEEFANANDRGVRILRASFDAGASPLQLAMEALNSGEAGETVEKKVMEFSASEQ